MARINPKSISKREDISPYSLDECTVVSTRKIRSADRSGKKGIARENGTGCVQADPAGGMTWRVDDRNRVASQGEFHFIMEMFVCSKIESGLVHRVNQDRRLRNPFDFRDPSRVINMSMGDEDVADLKLEGGDFPHDSKDLIPGINDHPFAGFLAPQEIAVRLVWAYDKLPQHMAVFSFQAKKDSAKDKGMQALVKNGMRKNQ